MTVRVVPFARIRELVGGPHSVALPPGSRVDALWAALAGQCPALAELEASTRIARNGRIAGPNEVLEEGDEIALFPPVGGG